MYTFWVISSLIIGIIGVCLNTYHVGRGLAAGKYREFDILVESNDFGNPRLMIDLVFLNMLIMTVAFGWFVILPLGLIFYLGTRYGKKIS